MTATPLRNRPYIFHRKEGWYPLNMADDADARTNAECNPGTLRVDDGVTGRNVWLPKKAPETPLVSSRNP